MSPFQASVSTDVFEGVSKHHLPSLKSTSHEPAIVPISMYLLTFAEAQRKSMIPILSVLLPSFFDHFCMISKKSWTINCLITSLALYFHVTGFMLSLLRVQGFRTHWRSEAAQTQKLWQSLEYYICNSIYNLYHIKDQKYLISKISNKLQCLNVSLQFSVTHFWEMLTMEQRTNLQVGSRIPVIMTGMLNFRQWKRTATIKKSVHQLKAELLFFWWWSYYYLLIPYQTDTCKQNSNAPYKTFSLSFS